MRDTFSRAGQRSYGALSVEKSLSTNMNVPTCVACTLTKNIVSQIVRVYRVVSLPTFLKEDPLLGSVARFPTVLHARASFSFDINPESLQKALVFALASLRTNPKPREITVADQDGYLKGQLLFRLGIGNGDGFDILDSKEEERVLHRIENRGSFNSLDLAIQLHYSVGDGRKHSVHEDYYILRLVFEPGRVEVLVHHLKGVRRVEPDELIRLLIQELNVQLTRDRYSQVELEVVDIT